MSIKEILQANRNQTEVEIFLSFLLKKDRSFLRAYPEKELTKNQLENLKGFLERRGKHDPVSYILGFHDFYGLRFKVTKDVLIPRPETEHLVEKVLDFSKKFKNPFIVDVGTGSGCIAISIAKKLPQAKIVALELDSKALEIARENIKLHDVSERVELIKSDLLSGLTKPVDIIVANLPYIPTERIKSLSAQVQKEPKIALDGGKSGVEIYKKLFGQAKNFLKPNGYLFCEIDNGKIIKRSFSSLQEDGREEYPELNS